MLEILPQILFFGLVTTAIYALIATGLTLIFGIMEFIYFAHGEMAMVGGYMFFWFFIMLEWPFIPSFLGAILIITVLGIIIEKLLFKPIRHYQAFIPLIMSIGVLIVLQSIIMMIFGTGTQSYNKEGLASGSFSLLDGKLIVTQNQITIIIVTIVLLTFVFIFLKRTKLGKSIRAVADNKDVASILGIKVNKVMTIVFALGSLLAGIAGILIAFEQNLTPTMGQFLSIAAFTAIILGGVGSLKGAILGAVIIGFSQNLIIGLTPVSGSYKFIIMFTILIIILLFRPYGIYGAKKEEEIRQ